MPSAMPSQSMQLPVPSSATQFIPVNAAHPSGGPTFLPPSHLASQQSADSTCTIVITQQQQHTRFSVQHASFPLSNLSQPAALDASGSDVSRPQHQAPGVRTAPAKRPTKGKKGDANATAAARVAGDQGAEGTAEGPVKRKRGPYKKRPKKEAEPKPPTGRKKKAISLLPAVQAFRLHGMQQQAADPDQRSACLATDHQPGPSNRAR